MTSIMYFVLLMSVSRIGGVNPTPSLIMSDTQAQIGVISAADDQSNPEFSLSISSSKDQYRVGEIVQIYVVQKNLTNHPIPFSETFGDAIDVSYTYNIQDENGQTLRHIPFNPMMPWETFSHSILPGKSVRTPVPLGVIYKFDLPGRYRIQVSRPDPVATDSEGRLVMIKSNTISIYVHE